MPVSPTYPGVYVQEVPSGVRTIVGVGTSIAMFIGASKQGPLNEPQRCVNYSAFRTIFGEDTTVGRLAQYVKLFFLNGGTDCWVMRIANDATDSSVMLKNENKSDALLLESKDPGSTGESIRALVTYDCPQPEVNFNLQLFRWVTGSTGARVKQDVELWRNLSMDPSLANYAEKFITQNSSLVKATNKNTAAAGNGYSLSGRSVPSGPSFAVECAKLLGSTSITGNRFKISVGGHPYVEVDLSGIAVTSSESLLSSLIEAAVTTSIGIPGVTVKVSFEPDSSGTRLRLKIASKGIGGGDVFIRPGSSSSVAGKGDLAVPLMLGIDQGGLEVSGFADLRPAPNGITFRPNETNFLNFGQLLPTDVTAIKLESFSVPPVAPVIPNLQSVPLNLQTKLPTDHLYTDAFSSTATGNSDGIREKLAIIVDTINAFSTSPLMPTGDIWPWKAAVWGYRLAILPDDSVGDNFMSSVGATPTSLTTSLSINCHYYSLGASGVSNAFQSPGSQGSDGTAPQLSDYDDAYLAIDSQVDLFNLMILPPVNNPAVPVDKLYGNASDFCQQRRAFLLMDPKDSWTTTNKAVAPADGVNSLRVGLAKQYCAVFFPQITINEGGLQLNIGPSGAIAGLMARIDSTRGVWKAPAGTEADLRGIVGLAQQFSDGENGILNPKAVNTLRVFPNGIVNWGARTMDGDDSFGSEYKYIPIRRLALFMEESLYRGLKWVVFEPNDEPLWAQIRLNVGAFMHNLFRQGAFQGRKPGDAYFVKCDAETTTQNDRDLGIVNVWVGFAPLKPAEFVILYLQQMAGQIQT